MMAGEAFLFLLLALSAGGGLVLFYLIRAEDDPGEPTDWETGRRRARRDTPDDERR